MDQIHASAQCVVVDVIGGIGAAPFMVLAGHDFHDPIVVARLHGLPVFLADGEHAAPLLEPLPGAWDGFFLGGPDALFRDDELELYYFGNRDLANANLFNSEIGHVRTVCRRP